MTPRWWSLAQEAHLRPRLRPLSHRPRLRPSQPLRPLHPRRLRQLLPLRLRRARSSSR